MTKKKHDIGSTKEGCALKRKNDGSTSGSRSAPVVPKESLQDTDSEFDIPKAAVAKKARVLTAEEESMLSAKRRKKKALYKKIDAMKRKEYPTIFTRSNPRSLFGVVSRLNNLQRLAVEEMGFGNVLRMNIKKLPKILAYWLVDRFNHRSRELELQKSKCLQVTEEDVRRVYGFPNGHRRITQFKSSQTTVTYEDWRNKFKNKRIFLTDLTKEMLRCNDGGLWFKRHFLILVCSTMIHSHKNGQVFPYIMHCLEKIDEVKQWNWSNYVMRSLISGKRVWEKNTLQMFTGPLMFLVILYCDRLAITYEPMERPFPLYLKWTTKALGDRESEEMSYGWFGEGKINDPIDLP